MELNRRGLLKMLVFLPFVGVVKEAKTDTRVTRIPAPSPGMQWLLNNGKKPLKVIGPYKTLAPLWLWTNRDSDGRMSAVQELAMIGEACEGDPNNSCLPDCVYEYSRKDGKIFHYTEQSAMEVAAECVEASGILDKSKSMAKVVEDVLAMRAELVKMHHYGPYVLSYDESWNQRMALHYVTYCGTAMPYTLKERLEVLDGITVVPCYPDRMNISYGGLWLEQLPKIMLFPMTLDQFNSFADVDYNGHTQFGDVSSL